MIVTAVIVTYNRSNDVMRCIDSVLGQTFKPANLIIVNNASTDDTETRISQYFNREDISLEVEKLTEICVKQGVHTYIYTNAFNAGGSGGFYIGMKNAHENLSSDFVWLMDDDGYPTENCLEQLLTHVDAHDYVMPTSINILNHDELSWPTWKRNGKKTIRYEELKNSWGETMEYVTPFNGVLLSRKCVSEVGYINKDFFIWGDDYEHYYRCKKYGFIPVTLLEAKFYHPAQKVSLKKICFGLFRVAYSESPLRMVCLARNWTYIYRHYNQRYKIPLKWIMYWWLFIITRHGDFEGWRLYKASVKDGFREDFTRHLQYLNK